MPIFLRGKTYHLRRRVPKRFAPVEERRELVVSLKTDSMERARSRADDVWLSQVDVWEALMRSDGDGQKHRYKAAQDLAKASGLAFIPADKVAQLPLTEIVERVMLSLNSEGKIEDRRGRAYLGTAKQPSVTVTDCLDTFFELTKEEDADRSPNQLRVRHNNFRRSIANFVEAVGDLDIRQLSADHMLQLREHYAERAHQQLIKAATANKEIKNFGTILRRVNRMKMLGLDLPLSGWGFKNAKDGVRKPFSTDWINRTLINGDALMGLNSEARAIVRLMINTGMRPSEAAGLRPEEIKLNATVPHIEIKARTQGAYKRAVKTQSAERVLPLVGVSYEALRGFPDGFDRYFDKAGLSATVNKYLRENNLMETQEHVLYCLRHSFEDRMLEAGIDERLRRDFMGHSLGRERYGAGGDLAFRHSQLKRVAL